MSKGKDMVRLGLIGLGTVGQGLVALLWRNRQIIEHRADCKIELAKISTKTPDKPRRIMVDPALMTNDPYELINDPNIDIVVELIGGLEPAYEYVMAAIEKGKTVVTANKMLLAKKGSEILDAAKERGVDVYFEASVAGGIPVIAALKESLVGNRIKRIVGIVNGTTNYILTRMSRDKLSFFDALKEAQAKGYAEADPTDDVEGFDAMYKIVILADIAFGYRLKVEDVHREGIRTIQPADIEYADSLGYVVKLLAIAKEDEGQIELRVCPALVPKSYPLAAVSDNFNGIVVEGDSVGRLMFYGQGAGAEPTASAVMGDIVDAVRNLRFDARGRVPCVCREQPNLKPMEQIEGRFCTRMAVQDKPGVLAKIANVFGEQKVSIASVVQRESDGKTAEIFWITHLTPYAAMKKSLQIIKGLDVVESVRSVLWVEGE